MTSKNRAMSPGPATLIETPGNVGRNRIDIEAEGVDGSLESTRIATITPFPTLAGALS